MFTKENIVSLPGRHVKFDILEESKLEILVNNDEQFDDVCQNTVEVLESIMEGSPRLIHYHELCIIYSFETSNRVCVLDLTFNK